MSMQGEASRNVVRVHRHFQATLIIERRTLEEGLDGK